MTVTINLAQSFAPIVTGLGVCVIDALGQTPAGSPDRKCLLVPTQTIPWDNCDCGGQLALAIQSVYGSSKFPIPADATRDWGPCGPSWQVAQIMISVVRCVPTMNDQGQPPSCDAELAAAITLENDRTAIRQALSCCLEDLRTAARIGGWAMNPSTTVGELGGCAGVETGLLVSQRSCLCGTT